MDRRKFLAGAAASAAVARISFTEQEPSREYSVKPVPALHQSLVDIKLVDRGECILEHACTLVSETDESGTVIGRGQNIVIEGREDFSFDSILISIAGILEDWEVPFASLPISVKKGYTLTLAINNEGGIAKIPGAGRWHRQ